MTRIVAVNATENLAPTLNAQRREESVCYLKTKLQTQTYTATEMGTFVSRAETANATGQRQVARTRQNAPIREGDAL